MGLIQHSDSRLADDAEKKDAQGCLQSLGFHRLPNVFAGSRKGSSTSEKPTPEGSSADAADKQEDPRRCPNCPNSCLSCLKEKPCVHPGCELVKLLSWRTENQGRLDASGL